MLSSTHAKNILTDLRDCQRQGGKVVFTNGCFDVLHIGHIKLLKQAKSLGLRLVVGLNMDESVRTHKGPNRPINNWFERAEILEALSCVDYVWGFEDLTPFELIKLIRPNVIVKGGDWNKEEVAGGEFIESYGGEVVIFPTVPGKSTTDILTAGERGAKAGEALNKITLPSFLKAAQDDDWDQCESGPPPEDAFIIKGKTFCFDIDGVIASIVPDNDYTKAEPIQKNIDLMHWLATQGATIRLYTARGGSSGKDWRDLTYEQMRNWKVPFSFLEFKKPSADYYIDDKMVGIDELLKLKGDHYLTFEETFSDIDKLANVTKDQHDHITNNCFELYNLWIKHKKYRAATHLMDHIFNNIEAIRQ